METCYLPKIRPENHETFRRTVSAYPADTYDNWVYLQANEIAEIIGAGDQRVVLVEVRTDEFNRYCDLAGCKRDFDGLRAFADSKGKKDAY
jgi:hypothetical protein